MLVTPAPMLTASRRAGRRSPMGSITKKWTGNIWNRMREVKRGFVRVNSHDYPQHDQGTTLARMNRNLRTQTRSPCRKGTPSYESNLVFPDCQQKGIETSLRLCGVAFLR